MCHLSQISWRETCHVSTAILFLLDRSTYLIIIFFVSDWVVDVVIVINFITGWGVWSSRQRNIFQLEGVRFDRIRGSSSIVIKMNVRSCCSICSISVVIIVIVYIIRIRTGCTVGRVWKQMRLELLCGLLLAINCATHWLQIIC